MAKAKRKIEPQVQSGATPALDQLQAAAYIADVALGLRGMAHRAELTFLTYLLDMVVHEAIERGERRSKFRDEPT
jgi:hypothetical protein